MALTPSKMIALGTLAPEFELLDVISGKYLTFQQLASPTATVVMFICNHCPFVIHVNQQLVQLANDYKTQNIAFIAINSNDVEQYPDDSPENMKLRALELNYPFPYLFDATQNVAKAYDAACTPDFFVFDNNKKLVYRGQLDDSRPGNDIPVTGKDLRGAFDALINGHDITSDQKPSVGCNIKWK